MLHVPLKHKVECYIYDNIDATKHNLYVYVEKQD